MPRNHAAAAGHVCPGIRIHANDIVQPPGIGIAPIADMDAQQTTVTVALAAKSSAETPKNACWEARSEAMRREISRPAVAPRQPRLRSALGVLVVAAPPEARLIAPVGCAVEPLVHAPEAVQPARVRRVGVVHDAVLERERAHAGPFVPVGLPVRTNDARCEFVEPGTFLTSRRPKVHLAEVVLDGSRVPFLLGMRRLEVVVEVAVERRRPGEAPAHPF